MDDETEKESVAFESLIRMSLELFLSTARSEPPAVTFKFNALFRPSAKNLIISPVFHLVIGVKIFICSGPSTLS